MSANGEHQAMTGPFAGLPLNPLGKLPGSVWAIPTQPLQVPAHLGVDHFAAFPTEWPRRIIQGWSPAGVCVECGEGRRPVVARERRNTRPIPLSMAHATAHSQTGESDGRDFSRGETDAVITGYACTCNATIVGGAGHCQQKDPDGATPVPPTRPAVVLDPFGGTGTTALVAKALGRHGITLDMSADYSRLATWRTNDRNQLARVLGVPKADTPDPTQLDLFGEATA